MKQASPTMTEAQWQDQVIDLARLMGYENIFHPKYSIQSASGFPDLVLLKGPRLIHIELKSETGQPSAEQYFWLYELQMGGHEAYLLRPSDWNMLQKILRG
jgi:hypothetical protein